MKEFIKTKYFIIIIVIGVVGFYLNGKIQENKRDEDICRELLNATNEMSLCKKKPRSYVWKLAKKEAADKIDDYVYEAKQIEKMMLDHLESVPLIDASKYIFLGLDKIERKKDRKKFLQKKVVISGSPRDCANPPWYSFAYSKTPYFFCIKEHVYDGDNQTDHTDKLKIIINNINDLNKKSKEIFERSYNNYFSFFNVTVFGDMIDTKQTSYLFPKIYVNADQIIFRIQEYTENDIKSEIERNIRNTYDLKIEDYLSKRKNK